MSINLFEIYTLLVSVERKMKRGTPSTKKRTFMLNLKSTQKQTISEKRKSKRIMRERERERERA
jgi:hypothetical protein